MEQKYYFFFSDFKKKNVELHASILEREQESESIAILCYWLKQASILYFYEKKIIYFRHINLFEQWVLTWDSLIICKSYQSYHSQWHSQEIEPTEAKFFIDKKFKKKLWNIKRFTKIFMYQYLMHLFYNCPRCDFIFFFTKKIFFFFLVGLDHIPTR